MSPSFQELEGLAGNKFRLKLEALPLESLTPREVYLATEAPAPGKIGRVVLTSCLSGKNLVIDTTEDVLLEKVD